MYKKSLLFLFLLSLISCDIFDYHPYDGRLSSDTSKGINTTNLQKITWDNADKDTIRFIWFGDSGRSLDELKAFVNHANQNDSIDFAIHSGDITEFGLKKEFEWADEILKKLKIPYVALIGNHDIIANGDKVFQKVYGDENFYFQVNDLLFLCLNTNAIEYDYSMAVPDFNFIKQVRLNNAKTEKPAKRTIVTMHAPPFNEQFNNNVAEIFQEKIKEYPDLLFCLHGHTHNFATNDFFDDGIIYYACDNMGKRSYLIFTITPDNYSYELVKF
ncbi:metallophosphoesterase [Parabacteroides sp. PF5-9]|uniref:metallophosphoesterase family protein n=1 Tax=Parabacteroides sp. PF5-9 TaxID=1742404 RepID=UPI0024758C67|nr:metallophosphoesterase [Parabacteroides sp. PF5-9]MDH6356508.1 Icc-related predicted phosphoesterase [Parabacteroides sp. PF5-9]